MGWLASNKHLLGYMYAGDHDDHLHISLAPEGLCFGLIITCPVTLSRSILSSGGVVAYIILNYYVSCVFYSY